MVAARSGSIGLALGSGGAKGLAHIVVLETLDELGLQPSTICGSSIGAIAGAAYASGMDGKQMRAFVLDGIADPLRAVRELMRCRIGGFGDLFSVGGNPVLLDAASVIDKFLPAGVPAKFADLRIPFTAVATDFYGKTHVAFDNGALRPALAASMAIPGIFRPVEIGGRVLIDGGVTDPLPFDIVAERARIVIAVDVNGSPRKGDRRGGSVPRPLDVLFASIQIMSHAITAEKLARNRPAIVIAPAISRFRVFDFLKAREILKAAAPAKDELKRALDAALERH
ncbi:MAG: patatin-like phospholipase family protein [Alphaproteobacteria bacterium]